MYRSLFIFRRPLRVIRASSEGKSGIESEKERDHISAMRTIPGVTVLNVSCHLGWQYGDIDSDPINIVCCASVADFVTVQLARFASAHARAFGLHGTQLKLPYLSSWWYPAARRCASRSVNARFVPAGRRDATRRAGGCLPASLTGLLVMRFRI